jgi:hypothetical protein
VALHEGCQALPEAVGEALRAAAGKKDVPLVVDSFREKKL